jgi:hypothetical protein
MGMAGDGREGIVRIGGPKNDKDPLAKPDVKVANNDYKGDPKWRRKPPMADADPRKVWQEALVKGINDPGIIIACADYMAQAEEWEHAAEFLKANLRQGIVVAPWVYESLAIALKESKASPEEVERAEVSEADLSPLDADGFLRASQAMATHKRYDHALAFCRQAAILAPGNPYVYSDALDYAVQTKDAEAMEWAAGNLLKRDWPENNQKLQLKAKDKLSNLVKALTDTNQAVAQKLEATLQQQRQRDLVIRLIWQGEADLDLKVTEPTGSVCSWQNRQTIGGGTLLGDTLSEPNRETYVAAQAFTGEYKIIVDRTWGRPLGDKAKLEIVRHQGTPDETVELVTVNLASAQSASVKLERGRRTTAAEVAPPETIKRPVETAELGGVDKVFNQLRALSEGNQQTGLSGGVGGLGHATPANPAVANHKTDPTKDTVTYQTRVEPFVSNTVDLTAQAVISADRRYVRLSLAPMFNVVSGVQSIPVIRTPLLPGGGRPFGP